ncbi:MAG: hypothetical protein WCC97_16300 [Candidatus Acidiferrales bacterium]
MTFDEWDHKLPNGFHDAEISTLQIDYPRRTMTLHMRLLSLIRGEYIAAVVTVSGLQFCSIGAPSPEYPYQGKSAITVGGDPAKSDHLPELDALAPTFPKDVACYRFFVHDWNNFIYIAAADVDVTFLGEVQNTVN